MPAAEVVVGGEARLPVMVVNTAEVGYTRFMWLLESELAMAAASAGLSQTSLLAGIRGVGPLVVGLVSTPEWYAGEGLGW